MLPSSGYKTIRETVKKFVKIARVPNYKDTDSHCYLNFSSSHPSIQLQIIHTL